MLVLLTKILKKVTLLKRFVNIFKQYKQLFNNKVLQLSNCNNKLKLKIN